MKSESSNHSPTGQPKTYRVEIDHDRQAKEIAQLTGGERINAPPPQETVTATLPTAIPSEGEINVTSGTWIFISQWAEKELANLKDQNDEIRRDEKSTAVLRGGIARLKLLLSLPDSAKEERRLPEKVTQPVRLTGYNRR